MRDEEQLRAGAAIGLLTEGSCGWTHARAVDTTGDERLRTSVGTILWSKVIGGLPAEAAAKTTAAVLLGIDSWRGRPAAAP